MRRRALLSSIGGAATVASAGCLDVIRGGGGGCGFEFTSTIVRVDHWCTYGTVMHLSVDAQSDGCEGEMSLEIVQDGEVRYTSTTSDDQGAWRFEAEGQSGSPSPGTVRLRLRKDDEVVAEETTEVDHYLDSPGVTILNPTVSPTTTTVGEPVTVTVPVSREGGGGELTAEVSADGETVWQREGTVEGGWDCGDANGPTFEASHAFEEPGEYRIRASISFQSPRGIGDDEDVGTVTVEEASG